MKAKFILSLALCFITSYSFAAESSTEPQISTNAVPSEDNNFDTIPQRHPELSMFVMLVNKAQLRDLFNGTGPFTVFAPTDEAFKKLGDKKIKELMKPENRDELSTILIYHIVPGKYMSKNLRTRDAPSVNGKAISINVENGEIRVNNAKVVKVDLVGPNGVLHEIDAVLIP
jgi:uncharacterized surface protein with fasciclin (FAS1) repeats